MTRQPAIARRAEELLGGAVAATSPLAGGDIATVTKLRLGNGTQAVMKTLAHAPAGFFAAEAAGLRRLGAVADGVAVPDLLAVAEDCLILRWVEPGRGGVDAAESFGRALARTHAAGAETFGAETFGADADGFIGRLPMSNRPAPTWAEFYATRRVLPYLRLAQDRGALSPGQAATVERLLPRLSDLVPEEPPSLLHGDLWNGNVLWAHGGEHGAYVIDPACYGGHREVDLAMLGLFGLPHLARVLAAYDEVRPLAPGWADRLDLHQLFPLLVHACLFGGGYGLRAAEIAGRY